MTVARDRHGIPHVSAGSLVELAREQGRMTAADRGRQIELDRRHAEGRVAEVAGPVALEWDRFARRVGLDACAQRAHAALAPEARAFVDAYADGVRETLPTWQPWSSLAVFAVQQVTFGAFPGKLWRAHVADRLGEEWVDRFPVETGPTSGSNAWLIGGRRTASGEALIGGDPHRLLETPGCYQQVRLTCPGVEVAGFTFPGVPGVQHFAHAGEVAWAITNAMADTQDLFVEQLRRDGSGKVEALGPEGWQRVDSWTSTIEVRGADPVETEVVVTPRGPVIIGEVDAGEGLALRTPPLVDDDLGFDVLPDLLCVTSVTELDRVLDRWVEPVNNVLMADRSGRQRYRVAGRVPERNPAARHRPVPAWVPAHAWTGYVAELPAHDVEDVEVTANERRGPESATVGHEFAAPCRADRLRELIDGKDVWSPDDAPLLHTDTWLATASGVVRLFAACEPQSSAERRVLAELGVWDHHMDPSSAGPALFAALRSELVRHLAGSDPLVALAGETRFGALFLPWLDHHARIASALDQWLQNPPPGIDLAEAATAALARVAAGAPPADWGSTHRYVPAGAPHVAVAGDTDCVLSTRSVPGVTDVVSIGPAARYVWDLADRGSSGWVVPLGAHDDPDHPHHHDQLDHWAAGRLLTLQED